MTNRKVSCIAIDDEPLALGMITSYINKTPFLELKAQFDNPLDAMEYLETECVDLLFLDIQMPDLTGMEFARVFNGDSKIIFTTAYEQYAIEGFQVNALDYLLKPISYDKFLASAQRAKEHFEKQVSSKIDNQQNNSSDRYLFIKADYQFKRVDKTKIIYLESDKDYIKLFIEDRDAPIVFHATMKGIELELKEDNFMRIHRSFMVNLDKVETIENNRILFGKEFIPISKQYKDSFEKYLKSKLLKT